ncbi:MAG: type II secretion system GspH family protein [Fimbriimonadales bacterium]|nr:type II secretion system GspH family protein [Fimbriimonadales bacterium]
MKRRAFTLVELLMVLGILSLLAALLFPVLAEARERGRSTRCLAQLRQLAQSTFAYLSDWQDHYPLAAYISQHNNQPCAFTLYHALVPYVKNRQIVVCPSDSDPMDVERVASQIVTLCPAMGFRQSSYMANWCLFELGSLAPVFHPPVAQAQVELPSETAVFFDAVMGGLPRLTPFIQGRHHERLNLAFADGHARSWQTRRGYGIVLRGDGRWAARYCLVQVSAYYQGGLFCESTLFGLAGRDAQGRLCWRCPNRPRNSPGAIPGNCGD